MRNKITVSPLFIIVSVIGFLSIVTIIIPPLLLPQNFPADDSFFYMQVGYFIAAGFGSTFNNISDTNGYHPLWMIFNIGAAYISALDKDVMIRVIFVIQQVITAFMLYIFWRIGRELKLGIEILLGLSVLCFVFLTGMYGSEAHINGLMQLSALLFFIKLLQKTTLLNQVCLGVFVGLSILARLDNVFLGIAFVLFLPFSNARIHSFPNYFWSLLPFWKVVLPILIIVCPYLLSNLIINGHLVPISGAIKSDFPTVNFNISYLGTLGQLTFVSSLFGFLLAFGVKLNKEKKLLLLVLCFGVIGHAMYVVLFSNTRATSWSWYYVSGIINIAFLSSIVPSLLLQSNWKYFDFLYFDRYVNYAISLVFIGILLFAGSRSWMRYYNPDIVSSGNPLGIIGEREGAERWQVQLGRYLKKTIPGGSRIYVQDSAGYIAWYSDLNILPVDGLINGYSYNDQLESIGIVSYLAQHNVHYFLGSIPNPEQMKKVTINSPVNKIFSGTLNLTDTNLVFKVRNVVNHSQTPNWGMWEIIDL